MSLLSRLFAPVFGSALLHPGRPLGGVTSEHLQSLVWKDIYGSESGDIVTRDIAMRCAPVKKARAVIIGHLAELPLEIGEFVNGEFTPDADQPAWLTTSYDVRQSIWHRMADTLDNVLFNGWALWAVERDAAGAITAAEHVAPELWRFDPGTPLGISMLGAGVIGWFNPTNADDLILFRGPDAGLLTEAPDSIRGWRYMERSWVGRVRNPIPAIAFTETEPGQATTAEIQQTISDWAAARSSDLGMVGFYSGKLRMEVHGHVEADLFDKGRNASRIDIANQTNLPVSYLDGSTATASLTYTTQEGTRAQIIDDLEYWLGPLEARLSMDDITGDPAKAVRFNRSNLTAVPNDTHGAERRNDPDPIPEVTE